MDKSIGNRKDIITINCREIPETIFVETRFLTLAAAKQKKYEELFYLFNKNGQMDLTRNEKQFMAFKNCQNTAKPTTVTACLQQATPVLTQPAVVQQSQIPSVITTVSSLPSHISSAVTTLSSFPSHISSAVTTMTTLPSIRSVPIVKLSSSSLKTNAKPNTASLTRIAAIPTTVATQIPVIDITANNAQATKPLDPPIISCKLSLKDNVQQTEISAFNMKSVGIQCQMAEEIEDLEIIWPTTAEGEPPESMEADNIEAMKALFLKFVEENSTRYKNFRECLICGEICKSNEYFYSHMAIHQGPKVLCFKCGFCFNNEDQLRKHNCLKANLSNKINLKCPHYRCRVTAISKLELYDHMNEHDNYRPYKCTGCRKAFFTRQEFLRHILIRAKCYTQARRKRYCIYNLENQRDRLCRVRVFTLHSFKKRTILVTVFLSRRTPKNGTCKICMRSISNARIFKSHHFKCVMKFRKRLIRKRYGVRTT